MRVSPFRISYPWVTLCTYEIVALGHSFALLEQWEAVIFSLLLYHIQALAFSFSNST